MADNIRVRALTTVFHGSRMYKPGDEFDYDGKLTDPAIDGMEKVTDKSTKAFEASKVAALKAAVEKAEGLRTYHADLVTQANAAPGEVGLAQKVIDADMVATDAEKEAEALQGPTDDLV
jgi:hypothetical protein